MTIAPDTVGLVIDAMPDPVLVVDAANRVLAFNAAAGGIYPALTRGEAMVRAIRSPVVLDAVMAVRASGEPQNVSLLERLPVERLFDVHARPIRDGSPGMLIALTLHDLTEARRVEQMRVDFVANASHELRTPLASLLGFVETLQGPARDDEKARGRFLDIMREQARRMARLVDDLLSLSRIEQNQHVRPETQVDLAAIVRGVNDTLGPSARAEGIELAIDAATPGMLRGDRDELIRVVENLVENALKYGADGERKRVEVGLVRSAGEIVLSVRDHGRGIAPEHLPRLTERFYRVDAGQSRARGGTGLGLAIVKHIVMRHRGRLRIESRPGEGALFEVSFPAL
jgi:two-component system phosphate regulon sensor histidine kinase PhoR